METTGKDEKTATLDENLILLTRRHNLVSPVYVLFDDQIQIADSTAFIHFDLEKHP